LNSISSRGLAPLDERQAGIHRDFADPAVKEKMRLDVTPLAEYLPGHDLRGHRVRNPCSTRPG
jgi:hypothetical protein